MAASSYRPQLATLVSAPPSGDDWLHEIKYDGYFARERESATRLQSLAAFRLPDEAPYERMHSLSIEARTKLARRRPITLAQAASIPGVSPADLQNLMLEVQRLRPSGAVIRE